METFTQFPKILRIIQDYYNKKVRFNLLEHELGMEIIIGAIPKKQTLQLTSCKYLCDGPLQKLQ